MERDIVHIDMDAFYVSVERLADPSLRRRPLIVGGLPSSRGVVACASYEARAHGVRSAMPMGKAMALCPDAAIVPPNFSLYERASKAVFDALKRYTPVIEPASIDEAYLDLTGTGKLFGPPRDVALKISREISGRLRLASTLGVASNRLVSKVASSVAKPSGIMDVRRGYEARMFAPLHIHYMPACGPKMQERLGRMGVGLIGELAAIPPPYLESAFGKVGLLLHDRSRGIDLTPVAPRRKKVSISSGETFPCDSGDGEFLRSMVFSHIERLCRELRSRGERASLVTVVVRFADFAGASASSRLSVESDIEPEIFPVASGLLDRILERRVLVRKVGVRFSRMSSTCWQVPLFDSEKVRRSKQLFSAIDRIRGRYGKAAVLWGRVTKFGRGPGGGTADVGRGGFSRPFTGG
ncbi:MAG: DNA polymerase IV [Pseudomonadota bacterium]